MLILLKSVPNWHRTARKPYWTNGAYELREFYQIRFIKLHEYKRVFEDQTKCLVRNPKHPQRKNLWYRKKVPFRKLSLRIKTKRIFYHCFSCDSLAFLLQLGGFDLNFLMSYSKHHWAVTGQYLSLDKQTVLNLYG